MVKSISPARTKLFKKLGSVSYPPPNILHPCPKSLVPISSAPLMSSLNRNGYILHWSGLFSLLQLPLHLRKYIRLIDSGSSYHLLVCTSPLKPFFCTVKHDFFVRVQVYPLPSSLEQHLPVHSEPQSKFVMMGLSVRSYICL